MCVLIFDSNISVLESYLEDVTQANASMGSCSEGKKGKAIPVTGLEGP
jgi:hypothetical protein